MFLCSEVKTDQDHQWKNGSFKKSSKHYILSFYDVMKTIINNSKQQFHRNQLNIRLVNILHAIHSQIVIMKRCFNLKRKFKHFNINLLIHCSMFYCWLRWWCSWLIHWWLVKSWTWSHQGTIGRNHSNSRVTWSSLSPDTWQSWDSSDSFTQSSEDIFLHPPVLSTV